MDTPLDLDSIDTVLATTRSVRRKLDFERPVSPALIRECINLATQAPTGAVAGESWRFMVVVDAQRKRALADLYGEVLEEFVVQRGLEVKPTQRALVARLHQIPAMILVCVDAPPPEPHVAAQVAFYGSILPAAWSLMLALRARRIGSTWTTLLSSRQQAVADILGMPHPAVSTVMLPVGHMQGAKLRKADRLDAAEVTYWDEWGNLQAPVDP